jgi:T-lymphoma invasion and metastasis-inducing protein 1
MTTAMSDDEGDLAISGRSALDSPKSGPNASGGVVHCGGAIRKAGFLCVKKWLLRRPASGNNGSAATSGGLSVELARRRGWRSYWVCLKGTTLLFYRSEQSAAELSHDPLLLTEDSIAPEQRPKHLLVVDGALVQPIPEHPKRDFVFCLSTVLGDAYLFQAPCQLELEHWTAEIHCACAAALSRHRGRSGTMHLLDETLARLQRRLDTEAKLRHVAELQWSAQVDPDGRRSAQSQLRLHEEALELCCVEQFRLRCYIASLLEREQPNPKTLLAHCSKGTKALLNRLGVFNVSSLHAFVCARSPAALNHLLACKSIGRRRTGSRPNSRPTSRPNSRPTSRPNSRPGSAAGNDQPISLLVPPDSTPMQVRIAATDTVEELLWKALAERPLHPPDFFIRCRSADGEVHLPARGELMQQLLTQYEQFEVRAKGFYQVELMRPALDQLFGFSVEAELVEPTIGSPSSGGSPLAELCVYVSRVESSSAAEQQQLGRADEILVINGALVSELDMMYIESVLQEELSLCMMLRTSRPVQGAASAPLFASLDLPPDEYIESLVCPPPPPDTHMSDEMIGRLIAPPPAPQLLPQQCSIETQVTSVSEQCDPWPRDATNAQSTSAGPINVAVTSGCLSSPTPPPPPPPPMHLGTMNTADDTNERVQSLLSPMPLPPPPTTDTFDFDPSQNVLSDTDRLKKVIDELLQTEQAYVQVRHLPPPPAPFSSPASGSSLPTPPSPPSPPSPPHTLPPPPPSPPSSSASSSSCTSLPNTTSTNTTPLSRSSLT